MEQPTLRLKSPPVMATVTWRVETSHLVASHGTSIPEVIVSTSLQQLRGIIQWLADGKKHEPKMGEIIFRYELTTENMIDVVHSYFTNKKGKLTRFMRLRREN